MENISAALVIAIVVAVFVVVVVVKTAVVVPQQNAFVVERLGKFNAVLDAGFHILVPFVDAIRYKHTLKEQAIDIPEQICITNDNVQVGVDGLIYLKVLDPQRASYGISDYYYAISQLAQTALRSEIGKITLDRTFEERGHINAQLVTGARQGLGPLGRQGAALRDQEHHPAARTCSPPWRSRCGPSARSGRSILASEGERDAAINSAEGQKQQVIKASEATRQQQINEAEGQAQAIQAIATATAEGLRKVAEAISSEGGVEAVQLRVAEKYVEQFGHIAKTTNTVVLPATLSDVGLDDRAGDERAEERQAGAAAGRHAGAAVARPDPRASSSRREVVVPMAVPTVAAPDVRAPLAAPSSATRPQTLPALFEASVDRFADQILVYEKHDGAWRGTNVRADARRSCTGAPPACWTSASARATASP